MEREPVTMMINFFWQFFALFERNDDWIFFLPFCLILAVPWLLGFLFQALHSKVRLKPLWLILWIATTTAVVIGSCVLINQIFEKEFDRWGSWQGMLVSLIIAVFLFCFFSWLGRKFNPRKKLQWLLIPSMIVASALNMWSFSWFVMMHPFASIEDEKLTPSDLEKSDGYDFEMITTDYGEFMDGEGNPIQPASFKIRGKGKSVYSRFVTEKNSDWTLMDESNATIALKLKKAVAAYSQEYSDADVLDGYCTSIGLYDFQEATHRHLSFCNVESHHVRGAQNIERMLKQLIRSTSPSKK